MHSKQSWPTPYKLSPLVATGRQDRQFGHRMVCLWRYTSSKMSFLYSWKIWRENVVFNLSNRRLQARRDSHMVVKPKNLESSLRCYFISNCHYRLFLFLELKFECLGRYNIKTCYLCDTDLSWHPNKLTVDKKKEMKQS